MRGPRKSRQMVGLLIIACMLSGSECFTFPTRCTGVVGEALVGIRGIGNVLPRGCNSKSPSRFGVRSIVGYEQAQEHAALAPERLAKVLETRPETPTLPSCLDPQDREARVRLSQILKQCTAIDLLQQQFSESIKDIGMHFGRDVSKAILKAEEELGGRGFRQFSSANSRLSSMNPEILLPPDLRPRKKRVVVLGSGWGAHAFVKVVDTDKFDVIAISPRPYFIFTPMLASSAVGTVEYRSITEPMRASNPLVDYYEAEASEIDTQNKLIHCKSSPKGKDPQPFRVPYDYLVVCVGMEPNTFGVPGVKEHCFFLKEVDDARALRSAIVNKFEAASLPSLSDEERIDLLTFVVVGGGPTGVEFSGELFDFLQQDVKRYYPKLAPLVRTKLLQSGKGVLETFDKNMQDMALSSLLSSGVEVILNARVTAVTEEEITIVQAGVAESTETLLKSADGQDTAKLTKLAYGVCVWACGNAPRPICRSLIETHQTLEPGKSYTGERLGGRILIDPWLRMIGNQDGSVFALGDCAESEEGPLPQTAQVAAQQGAFVAHLLNDEVDRVMSEADAQAYQYGGRVQDAIEEGVRAGDAVAMALQQSDRRLARPFEFLSLGILAYVGNRKALAQVEVASQKKEGQLLAFNQQGLAGWILWRSVYLTKQVAFRNRVLVLFDWVKSRVFGRDIACL